MNLATIQIARAALRAAHAAWSVARAEMINLACDDEGISEAVHAVGDALEKLDRVLARAAKAAKP